MTSATTLTDLKQLTRIAPNGIYILDGYTHTDQPAIEATIARLIGLDRNVPVVQAFTMKKGEPASSMRFMMLSGSTAQKLQTSVARSIATLTPGSFLIAQAPENVAGLKRSCTNVSEAIGGTFKVEYLKINDARLNGLGLTEEDREEIYDDDYFVAITRTA